MSLVVQTNNAAVTAQKNININSMAQNKALARLSSGFRLNSAADDAAGFAIAAKLNAFGGRLTAASNNALQGTALVKTADAALNEIQNIITRIQSLAIQASSANNGSAERTKLDAERKTLESQIDNFSKTAEFNGVKLLDGTGASSTAFQVGAQNTANDRVSVDLSTDYSAIAGLSLAGTGTAAALATATDAQAYIATLSTALDTVVTGRANLGAAQNQLGFVNANLATAIEQVTASVSTIRDADIASEMANFTKSQILVQAGTAMLAQANQASQNVLRLFR